MSFLAIAHAADSSQERRVAHPTRSIDGMDCTPSLQAGQPDEHILKVWAKCRDTDHFEVMRAGINHNGIDNLRWILSIELKLVTGLLCFIYQGKMAQLIQLICRILVKRELDRLHTLYRLFQAFRCIDRCDIS